MGIGCEKLSHPLPIVASLDDVLLHLLAARLEEYLVKVLVCDEARDDFQVLIVLDLLEFVELHGRQVDLVDLLHILTCVVVRDWHGPLLAVQEAIELLLARRCQELQEMVRVLVCTLDCPYPIFKLLTLVLFFRELLVATFRNLPLIRLLFAVSRAVVLSFLFFLFLFLLFIIAIAFTFPFIAVFLVTIPTTEVISRVGRRRLIFVLAYEWCDLGQS